MTQKLWRLSNTERGYEQMLVWLHPHSVSMVVAEATGGLELLSLKWLHEAGYKVARVNPRSIKDFTRSAGRIAKTDTLDALRIALYGCRMRPEVYIPLDADGEAFKALTARHRQLVDEITMENNRLKQSRHHWVIQLHKETIRFLEYQLKEVDTMLATLTSCNEDACRKKEIITSIPGVGEITAHMLIADLPELGKLGGKQIAALIGVAPFNRDSGTGKKKKVALVAVMPKLIVILNAMVRKNVVWTEATPS